MKQCRTCGGRYAPVTDDGFLYFHGCAPVFVLDVVTAHGGDPAGVSLFATVARDNARNENLTMTADGKTDAIADGAGVLEIADDTPLRTVADVLADIARKGKPNPSR